MGTWGAGNFQDDAALDFVFEVMSHIQTEVLKTLGDDIGMCGNEHRAVCGIAIISELVEHCHATPPKPSTVDFWLKHFMVRDEDIFASYDEDTKDERRKTVIETFERLKKQAEEYHAKHTEKKVLGSSFKKKERKKGLSTER